MAPHAPEVPLVRPYVSAEESPTEFSCKAVVAGIAFGIVFGAANAYLGLYAGLTISTSIPISVVTVAAFRALRRAGAGGTILEANLSQTIGSASSSVASGVIFTLPALFLWGMAPSLAQMTLLALCGGVLGTLFMIPLRRYLIVREHANLPYPEGTACAQVLVAAEAGGDRARHVFAGLGVGAAFKALVAWARAVPSEVGAAVPLLPKGHLGTELSAALLGVGYILGPRVATIMVAGGLLSSLGLIPLIDCWGAGRTAPVAPEPSLTIAAMTAGQIWNRYVRYIGAGAVAMAGIVTLVKSIPTLLESFRLGLAQLRVEAGGGAAAAARTDRDLPLSVVGAGALAVGLLLALPPLAFGVLGGLLPRAVATVCVIVGAFFFVTVSSRIVGLVGVTSNPTSGMTIATLLGTSTVFLALGWTDAAGRAAALTVGAVVAVAASIAGDVSQDLKTGFLLGATPRRQQVGELLGVLTSAAFVCLAVGALHQAYGFGTPQLPAPQATLMKVVVEGVLAQSLPWGFVAIGAGIALAVEALGLPALAFCVGVYLPVATMVPVFLGGLLAHLVARRRGGAAAAETDGGVLFGSGLVGGEGLMGVAIAVSVVATGARPAGLGPEWAGAAAPWLALGCLAAVGLDLVRRALPPVARERPRTAP